MQTTVNRKYKKILRRGVFVHEASKIFVHQDSQTLNQNMNHLDLFLLGYE